MQDDQKLPADPQHKDAPVKPDTETLHTTDPQEHMEGPVSSLVQGLTHSGKHDKSKEEADRERDEKM